jgi:polysaccharide deacetylase 2 family uncharacterized protein YibQ
MAKKSPSPKQQPFGLSIWTLAGIAVVSVVVGLGLGVAADLLHRPPAPVAVVHQPRRDVPPPVVRDLTAHEDADSGPPSVLAPRAPDAAAPPHDGTQDVARALPPPSPRPETEEQPPPAPQRAPVAVPALLPRTKTTGAPVVAIVIDDLGLDRAHTDMVLALPPAVTLSLMTYADHVGDLANRARAAGHEILAHVPMQPLSSHEDPGPHALTVAMDGSAVRATLAHDLDGWQGYVGVNNHMGSRFTADRAHMDMVMDDLRTRGLLWLDSRTTAASAGPAAAQAAGVPYVTRDIFLDNVETVAAVRSELAHLVAAAKAHGSAIAIGHPHAATIAALKDVLPTLADQGVTLVPVTEILRRQQAPPHPS